MEKDKWDVKKHGHLLGKFLAVQIVQWLSIAAQVLAVFLAFRVDLFPDREGLVNILSTFAEIVAGLYGITAAGYTFFLSRIDSLTASDPTLGFVVESVKKRFQGLILYITVNMAATLLITIALMYVSPPAGGLWLFLYRLGCNEFLLFVISTMSMILCYSLMVINPKCIENEAEKLKKKLSPDRGIYGSTLEFLSLCQRMEALCCARLPQQVLSQLRSDKGLPFDTLLELLKESAPELEPHIPNIRRIRRYYECTVNCNPMTVTQEMLLLAREVVEQLEN